MSSLGQRGTNRQPTTNGGPCRASASTSGISTLIAFGPRMDGGMTARSRSWGGNLPILASVLGGQVVILFASQRRFDSHHCTLGKKRHWCGVSCWWIRRACGAMVRRSCNVTTPTYSSFMRATHALLSHSVACGAGKRRSMAVMLLPVRSRCRDYARKLSRSCARSSLNCHQCQRCRW